MADIISQITSKYDAARNRTQGAKGGVTTNHSYNNFNQLTGFSEPGRQMYFYYDDNGNRIRRTENGVVCVSVPVAPLSTSWRDNSE